MTKLINHEGRKTRRRKSIYEIEKTIPTRSISEEEVRGNKNSRQEGIACADNNRVAQSKTAAAPRLRFGLGLRNNFSTPR
jgi:hypothetical protein